jgi:hypothetical protein
MTFGFLVGELVRRITGTAHGRFFADEVAAPLYVHSGLANHARRTWLRRSWPAWGDGYRM